MSSDTEAIRNCGASSGGERLEHGCERSEQKCSENIMFEPDETSYFVPPNSFTVDCVTTEFSRSPSQHYYVCACDHNDKSIKHGPLCPGAPNPMPPNDISDSFTVDCVTTESSRAPSDSEANASLLRRASPLKEELVKEIVPKLIFIVPYRDREQQHKFFTQHMKMVLEDLVSTDYKIYYAHQNDTRDFNRGAMKNIGFLAVKDKYPNDYKNITLVFNDIDTMPFVKNFLDYNTTIGNIKHFYGYTFTLGGIVSINAGDFEKISGFPNFWAWGYEDNLLQKRVLDAGLKIDRSQFYPLMDKNIFQMKDGLERIVNRSEFDRFVNVTNEGIHSISNLKYIFNESTGFINVTKFNTGNEPNAALNSIHDLRHGSNPFNITKRSKPRMGMNML